MRKRGFLLKMIAVLPPVLAVMAVCVFLYIWHTVGFPHARNRAVPVSLNTRQTTPEEFHACVPDLVTHVFADLKLNPRNIRRPRADKPDSSGKSIYTVLVPPGESFYLLHLKLSDAARDSGGMAFDAVETMEGDQIRVDLGASGIITDTIVIKRTAGRKRAEVRAAIVILDAGERDISNLKGLLRMDVRITLAIRPSSRYAQAAAKLAGEAGMPVILYLPSGGTEKKAQEYERILPSEPDEVIREKLEKNFDAVPEAEGVMFSLESRSDDDIRGLETIMDTLRGAHRCYIDMLPHTQSPGCAVAGRRWVKAAGTAGLVDGVFASTQGRAGLRALIVSAAEHTPSVVACSSDPAVIGFLTRELPVLKSGGIRFVGAGEAAR